MPYLLLIIILHAVVVLGAIPALKCPLYMVSKAYIILTLDELTQNT